MAVVNAVTTPASNLEYALHYASLGWGVFPAHTIKDDSCSCGNPDCTSPGKHPRTKNGLKDATTDSKAIEWWWKKFPASNIAIRTGKESGVVALDIDTKSNGFESLEALVNTVGSLPDTLTAITGGKGNHICFTHPGGTMKTRANVLEGIDFRGDGGYIIAPPSLHISGSAYHWIDLNVTLVEPPEWLLKLIDGTGPVTDKAPILEGSRNSSLMSLAGKKRSEGASKSDLRTFLLEENRLRCNPPLAHVEVIHILKQVTSYEAGEDRFLFTWKKRFMDSDLPSSAKLVLHTLADHMNIQGRSCYPTQEKISLEASLSSKTVRSHLDNCVAGGWIMRYPHRLVGQDFWNYGYIARLPDR
jgi:hypothetical protein